MATCKECLHVDCYDQSLEDAETCNFFLHNEDYSLVVRCKECKHFSPRNEIEGVSWTGWCNYGEFHTDEEDFCSRGERKEE